MKRLRLPPGPPGHPLLGNLLEFRRNPLGFYTRCAREYGDIVHLRIANASIYHISNPDDINTVLVANARNFSKGRVLQAQRSFLGNGLLISEGDAWLQQRRLLSPAFHREHITTYANQMADCALQMMAVWDTHTDTMLIIDLYKEMKALALQVIAGTLFSVNVADDVTEASTLLTEIWEQFSRRISSGLLIPESIPTPGNIRMRRATLRLDEVVYRIIATHRTNSSSSSDMLSTLLAATDATSDAMSQQQLRDEVLTFFVAGHETSAATLSWVLYLLALHPDVEANILQELRQVLGGRIPTAADLPALVFTESIVLETLRLYPPVWAVPRVALCDCEIGGYTVPAGASVTSSQWVMHRDPRYFDQPDRFMPERWEGPAAALPHFAYFPFGGGPRQCIGSGFAMMEITLLLATILQRYYFDLVAGQVVTPQPSLTLYPRDGIWVKITRRAAR